MWFREGDLLPVLFYFYGNWRAKFSDFFQIRRISTHRNQAEATKFWGGGDV
jgi:hypothetical protein